MNTPAALSRQQQQHLRSLLERGLPLCSEPYAELAKQIDSDTDSVLACVRDWQEDGLFRRFGLVVRHHALGYHANAMLVLDIPDALVASIGEQLAEEPRVTLCYQRPRRLPQWRYNLFCMIHGRARAEVEGEIAAVLHRHQLAHYPHEWLFSTQAFKQRGGHFSTFKAHAVDVGRHD
ncbi:siroheme decarboxylase subunit beta [Atopomonas sediminilitoris]|uniref:siroheme decarboxylase subunit beta n=1 Tax=Atopomonas sediminilitoris TaxID=2919919 RepID=UPI001F4D3A0D|nr:AsnC family protein [Atopomonas sediminilitoris]MCJ8170845.1 AsnC family protein [Atopomonas sediminilitoris]